MPHSVSAKKSLRQSQRRYLYNRSVKSAVKTQIKRLRHAVDGGNAEEMQQQLRATARKLYQAASKGVIHKNFASRKLAQLARQVNVALSRPAAPTEQ